MRKAERVSFAGSRVRPKKVEFAGGEPILSGDVRILGGLPHETWPKLSMPRAEGITVVVSREEIDAKLDRTEAKVEKTLAEMRADFSGLRADMSAFREQIAVKLNDAPSKTFIVGTAIAIVAALVAVIGVGAAMYGNGIMVATSSVDRANQALAVSEQNQSQIQTLTQDIGAVLEEVRALRQQPAQSEE